MSQKSFLIFGMPFVIQWTTLHQIFESRLMKYWEKVVSSKNAETKS